MRQRTKCEISGHLSFISSNTRILPMKRLVTIVLILLSGCTTAPDVTENAIPSRSASVAGVRFDVHRADAISLSVVARGRPGQSTQMIQTALSAYFARVCSNATSVTMDSPSEYEFLEGGNEFLMPAGGVFIPAKTYHAVKRAPLLHGSARCDLPATSAMVIRESAPVRLEVVSNLGESIPFIDQGFASFNRERLDVPVSGATPAQTAKEAVKQALLARGYKIEVVAPGSEGDAKIVLTKAPVPYEQFAGLALLTKLGLLGIENRSAAFCSITLALYSKSSDRPLSLGTVSTRDMMPAVYKSWKDDMANGPSASILAKASPLLNVTLPANVKAAIHAIPPEALQSSFGTGAQ